VPKACEPPVNSEVRVRKNCRRFGGQRKEGVAEAFALGNNYFEFVGVVLRSLALLFLAGLITGGSTGVFP
jgi:hypothetical protein